MSTKTTFKRIALATVAAMGFGLLSVVPANAEILAGDLTFTKTDTTANTIAAPTARGTQITAALSLTTIDSDGAGAGDGVPSAAATIPATFTLLDPNGTDVTSSATFSVATTVTAGVTATVSGATYTLVLANAAAKADRTFGNVSFIPTMGGRYTLRVTRGATTGVVLAAAAIADVTNDPYLYVTGGGAVVASSGIGTNSATAVAGGIAQARFATSAKSSAQIFTVTSSGVGVIQTASASTGTPQNANGIAGTSDYTQGVRVLTSADTNQNEVLVNVASTVSGVQTLTMTGINPTTGAPSTVDTVTITWGAAPAVSTQYSAVRIGAGTTGNGVAITSASASDATVATTVSSTPGTQRFVIRASTFDQNNAAISVASFGASITGPGLLAINNTDTNTTAGNGRSVSTAAASNTATVSVWGDGSAGAATITITATSAAGVTTTLGTKTVTFVGAPASVTVTQNLFIARAGQALGLPTPTTSRVAATDGAITTTPAIRASVLDAGGNPVAAGSVVRIISSDESVIVPGACAEYTVTGSATVANTPAPGRFECVVSGANAAASGSKATVTFQVQNAATGLWSISATPITFAIGGTIASVELATDKTSYAPGEAMVMTATAKDSAGNPAADGLRPYVSVSANMSLLGLPNATAAQATTAFIVNGVHTTNTSTGVKTMFAPSSVGNLVVSGLTTNATTGTAYSVALKIENADLDSALAAAADAAAEATDAANAATDAANAAAEAADAATAAAQDAADAVAALSTSVTAMVDSLRKQITSLTNLVIKIQRKVRA
jgi:trimeric autotransporter adhesin